MTLRVYHEIDLVKPREDGRLHLECWVPYVFETEAQIALPGALHPEPLPRGDDEPFRCRVNFGDYVGRWCRRRRHPRFLEEAR